MGRQVNEKDYIVTTLEDFFSSYSIVTLDEYFRLIDKETQKRSKMVAKSLTKYLSQTKQSNKYNNEKGFAISF